MPIQNNNFQLELSKRTFLYESFYLDHLSRSVQILIANSLDLKKLQNFLNFHGFQQKLDLNESLKEKQTLIVADCYEICGIGVGIKRIIDGNETFWVECLFVREEYLDTERWVF